MENPWIKISLTDYESHMKLDSVMQIQAMNEMMKHQFYSYPISSLMILGIAGGNGLEHIQVGDFEKVYGIDINASYIQETTQRYPKLNEILECLCIDLVTEAKRLPNADMIVANLLLEYIGYESFQSVVKQVNPIYVSCIIQNDVEDDWVSDSPYLHVFDGLEKIHQKIHVYDLEKTMSEIGYHIIKTLEYQLPNRKKLIQIDFEK